MRHTSRCTMLALFSPYTCKMALQGNDPGWVLKTSPLFTMASHKTTKTTDVRHKKVLRRFSEFVELVLVYLTALPFLRKTSSWGPALLMMSLHTPSVE